MQLVKQGKTALQTLQDKVSKSSGTIVSFGGGLLTEVVEAVFDLVLVFVLSIYMLLYGERIGALVRRRCPRATARPRTTTPRWSRTRSSRYVGGQLLFSLLMGVAAGACACTSSACSGSSPTGRSTRWPSACSSASWS